MSVADPLTAGPAGPDSEYAAGARRLTDRLVALTEPDADGAPCWSGDDVDPARSTDQEAVVVHDRLDDGLLTGRAGIAVTLVAAGRLPGARPEWMAVGRGAAHAAVRSALAQQHPPARAGGLGWCSGWLGIARAARLVGGWTSDAALLRTAQELAGRAVRLLAERPAGRPDYPDLLDGLAGHLTAVLAADLEPALEAARHRAAESMLRRLVDFAGGGSTAGSPVSWPMAGTGPAVIGLAHGGSGIAMALAAARAAGLGVRGELSDLIVRTRQWEDGHFQAGAGGWPDLRTADGAPGLAWCHGAPGVGVAAAYRALVGSVEGSQQTVARACAMVADHAVPSGADAFDGTLCHGLTGSIELHLLGAQAWPAAAGEQLRAARLLARHLTRAGRAGRAGWVCGVRGGRTPNVLVGLAGVAYTLIRCHNPDLAPSLAHPGLPATTLAEAAV